MPLQDGHRYSLQERRGEVVKLKRAGHSDRQIALILDEKGTKISHTQVHNDWRTALKELIDAYSNDAVAFRAIQNDRYAALLQVWWPRAMAGDEKALDKVLSIIKGIREINGLDLQRPTTSLNMTQINVDDGSKVGLADLARLLYESEREQERRALPGSDGNGYTGERG